MENVNQLTEKDVTEILSQREELLEGYRKRLEMLSREYEDAGELIEMLQLRSPSNDQEGSKSQEIKGLDDIYMLYEKQKKKRIYFSRADSSACDIRHYHGNRVSIFYTILESSRVSQK